MVCRRKRKSTRTRGLSLRNLGARFSLARACQRDVQPPRETYREVRESPILPLCATSLVCPVRRVLRPAAANDDVECLRRGAPPHAGSSSRSGRRPLGATRALVARRRANGRRQARCARRQPSATCSGWSVVRRARGPRAIPRRLRADTTIHRSRSTDPAYPRFPLSRTRRRCAPDGSDARIPCR